MHLIILMHSEQTVSSMWLYNNNIINCASMRTIGFWAYVTIRMIYTTNLICGDVTFGELKWLFAAPPS